MTPLTMTEEREALLRLWCLEEAFDVWNEIDALREVLKAREAEVEDWKGACLTFAEDAYHEGHDIGQGETTCEVNQTTEFSTTETAERIRAAFTPHTGEQG